TPAGGYAVEDWGCVESDEVRPDGHRPCARHAVSSPEDWKKIRPVKMESTGWASHLETIIRCVVDKRADCSTMPTVFSPLSLARRPKAPGAPLKLQSKGNPRGGLGRAGAHPGAHPALREALLPGGPGGFFLPAPGAHPPLPPRGQIPPLGRAPRPPHPRGGA